MLIYIECLNDNLMIKVDDINSTDKVIILKKKIKEREYIPIDEQILYYNCLEMRNDDMISKHLSKDSEVLNLVIRDKYIDLTIKTMFDKEIIIKNITSQTLIEEIFLILFYYYDLHPDDISLIYKGNNLNKSMKLAYYNIVNNNTINLIIKTKSGF